MGATGATGVLGHEGPTGLRGWPGELGFIGASGQPGTGPVEPGSKGYPGFTGAWGGTGYEGKISLCYHNYQPNWLVAVHSLCKYFCSLYQVIRLSSRKNINKICMCICVQLYIICTQHTTNVWGDEYSALIKSSNTMCRPT